MKELKQKIEKARRIQEVVIDGAESDAEKQYALGWLHCLDSVLIIINQQSNI